MQCKNAHLCSPINYLFKLDGQAFTKVIERYWRDMRSSMKTLDRQENPAINPRWTQN